MAVVWRGLNRHATAVSNSIHCMFHSSAFFLTALIGCFSHFAFGATDLYLWNYCRAIACSCCFGFYLVGHSSGTAFETGLMQAQFSCSAVLTLIGACVPVMKPFYRKYVNCIKGWAIWSLKGRSGRFEKKNYCKAFTVKKNSCNTNGSKKMHAQLYKNACHTSQCEKKFLHWPIIPPSPSKVKWSTPKNLGEAEITGKAMNHATRTKFCDSYKNIFIVFCDRERDVLDKSCQRFACI